MSNPDTREIPVIFLTGCTDKEDEAKGLAMGARDYITKPINPALVLARVQNQIELHKRQEVLKSLSNKLSRYLSPQVYRSIFEGKQEAEVSAKRKKLTIFFSDIKDFTESTENLQPEDLTYLLNKYFSEMSSIAEEYGATIDKYVGDAMLMFFGDPQSKGVKDDALQCVRMAVAMQLRMRQLQELWRKKGYERPFRMRIGINTGYCNVGNFGSVQRLDYTVIGGEVNLAARLEQNGEPDGVMMSYETYALVQDEFIAEERAPLRAKGIAREIRCFSLLHMDEPVTTEHAMLQKIYPGLKLSLNPDLITGANADQILSDLGEAIKMVQTVMTQKSTSGGQ